MDEEPQPLCEGCETSRQTNYAFAFSAWLCATCRHYRTEALLRVPVTWLRLPPPEVL